MTKYKAKKFLKLGNDGEFHPIIDRRYESQEMFHKEMIKFFKEATQEYKARIGLFKTMELQRKGKFKQLSFIRELPEWNKAVEQAIREHCDKTWEYDRTPKPKKREPAF